MSDNPPVVMEVDATTVVLLQSLAAMRTGGPPGDGAPPEVAAAWAEDYLHYQRDYLAIQTTIKARLFLTARKAIEEQL